MLQDLFDDHLSRELDEPSLDTTSLPTHGAVFALTDREGRLVQLAAGQNLRRAVMVRLQPPPGDRPRVDLAAVTARVWWAASYSQFETTLRYHAIARVLYPKDYRKMCAFGPAWFAVIDTAERLARWRVSDDPGRGASACVGPFARRSTCEQFIQHLEHLHALCREHHILDQTPNGEACAYYEMGRCPAPCDGTIPLDDYRDQVAESIQTVLKGASITVETLRDKMHRAARELAFEEAGRMKEDMKFALDVQSTLRGKRRRREDFRYLVIQRGRGRTWVKAFFVSPRDIAPSEAVRIRDLEQTAPEWLARMGESPGLPADAVLSRERIWIVSHFLHRRDHGGGLFLHVSELPRADELARIVSAKFAPRQKAGRGPRQEPK